MQTPLAQVHAALGARMTDFAGWNMPLRYGSAVDEHLAVRSAAGIFDLSHMGEIDVAGPDAARFVDYAFIGELSTAAIGQARYTMMCDAAGHMIDDLVIYRRGDDRYLVVPNASNTATVLAEMKARANGLAVSIEDRSNTTALIAVQGPNSEDILADVTGGPAVRAVKYYRGIDSRIGDIDAFVARTGYTGEDGYEVYVDFADAVATWQTLIDAGADLGLVPVGLAARDTLRLEAGMALYGNELNATLTPFDAGAAKLVAFGKDGDFVGRDALESAKDEPHHLLVGLGISGRRPAREGYPVLTGDQEPVGVITSGTLSPTLERPIAMARLNPGTDLNGALMVDVRGDVTDASIEALPFYRRPKK